MSKTLRVEDKIGLVSVEGLTIGGADSASWTEVIDATARPPRAAGIKVEDDGSAADKLVDFLVDRKLI